MEAVPQPVSKPESAETTEPDPPVAVSDNTGSGETTDFTFQPADGGRSIVVPPVSSAIPENRQRWFFWKLRKLEGLEQPIFWLEQASVPDVIQEQIMLLPDQEWTRFFEEWMAFGTGATAGE